MRRGSGFRCVNRTGLLHRHLQVAVGAVVDNHHRFALPIPVFEYGIVGPAAPIAQTGGGPPGVVPPLYVMLVFICFNARFYILPQNRLIHKDDPADRIVC